MMLVFLRKMLGPNRLSHEDIPGDPEAGNNVDTLVEKLVGELAVDQAIHAYEIAASPERPASGVQSSSKADGIWFISAIDMFSAEGSSSGKGP